MRAIAIHDHQNMIILRLLLDEQVILLSEYSDYDGTEFAHELLPKIKEIDDLIQIFMLDPFYYREQYQMIQSMRERMRKLGIIEESQAIISMRDTEEEQDLKEVLLKSYGATDI